MHLLAVLLLAAAPADTYPTAKGTVGVTFYLPSTSTDQRLVGVTYFVASDMAARLDFGLNAPLSPNAPGIFTTFVASAGLRFYEVKRERVGVFLQPSVALGREASPAAITAGGAEFVRLGAGVGVEYFFTNHFSAGAILEVALKLANISGPANSSIYTTLATDTSFLSANIYF